MYWSQLCHQQYDLKYVYLKLNEAVLKFLPILNQIKQLML